jgi:hypothetical protein
MLVFNNYFYKNKKSKLYFWDRADVLNDFLYQTGGSRMLLLLLIWARKDRIVYALMLDL